MNMNDKPVMRWGQMVAMLREEGFSEYEVRQMKAEGVIVPLPPLRKNARAFYSRDEVRERVLKRRDTQRPEAGV